MPAFLRRVDRWASRYWWAIPAALVAVAAGVIAAVLQFREPPPGPAPQQSAACRFGADGVVDVRVSRSDGTVVIARGPGDGILVDGRPCGAASVRTAEAVVVEAGDGAQTAIVDLVGGPFADPDAGTRLPFRVDLGSGEDLLEVRAHDEGAALAVEAAGVRIDAGEGAADPEGDPGEDPEEVDVTVRRVERIRITGGGGDDVLTGAPDGTAPWPGPLSLDGGDGGDLLGGGDGDDVLRAGPGDDRLLAGPGEDLLDGGDGEDTVDLSASVPAVEVDLRAGVARAGEGDRDALQDVEHVVGGSGDDVLRGNDRDNRLEGGPGDDTLAGGAGDDVLDGGPGTDTGDYGASLEGVRVDLRAGRAEGDGDDEVVDLERLVGGPGDDELLGDGDPNVLDGGAGDDLLDGRGGQDRLFGGIGTDLVVGGAGRDVLRGDGGGDTVRGGPGDDLVDGGRGDDRLIGGAGTDTVDYSASTGGVTVNIARGRTDDDGLGGGDTLSSLEDVVATAAGDVIVGGPGPNELRGGRGDDVLVGGGGDDVLRGAAGADTLTGGPGDDELTAGADDDRVIGGAGDDVLDGGAGRDTADYARTSAGIVVDLGAGVAFRDGWGGSDDLFGIEDVTGGSGEDVLRGDDGPNLLLGGPGGDLMAGAAGVDVLLGGPGQDSLRGGPDDDLLNGGLGDDLLNGGHGSDRLAGGLGTDTADYQEEAAGVEVDLGGGAARDGAGGEDVIQGIEHVAGSRFADLLIGDDQANRFHGGGGDDRLHGRDGDDRLIGAGGDDLLDGGPGEDVCIGGPGANTFRACEVERGGQSTGR